MSIKITKNDQRECVTIEGITYSYEFFRQFASKMPLDTLMAIKSRDGGVLHVVEAEPGDLFKVKGGLPYKMPFITAPSPPIQYFGNEFVEIKKKPSWFDRLIVWLGRR